MTKTISKKNQSSAKFALDDEFVLLQNANLQRPTLLDDVYIELGKDEAIARITKDGDLFDE